jgi:hypothetical protein
MLKRPKAHHDFGKKTMDLYVKPHRVKYNFHTYDPMGLLV